jgi:Tfp pilus assembly protein PilN
LLRNKKNTSINNKIKQIIKLKTKEKKMQTCLGIYVEEKLIKYAKISKDHEFVKVEAYGIKFYDDLEKTIKQIISETYSFKTPISINISDEQYTYTDLFSLLNKKDLEKAINTEFDVFCNDSKKNRNAIEMRHMEAPNLLDRDKITTVYSYCDKSSIVSKLQLLDGCKVEGILPLPIALYNLKRFQNLKNSIIVNIESKTTVTTIVNGKVYKIDIIEDGMRKILDNINVKENSYQKSYEICKNSTIYTLNSKNLQTEENDYMDDIMPTLYSIVQDVKDIIKKNVMEVQNIYITGLATSINNLDLYFQENFGNINCEILTPYFTEKENLKLNIKDYIEVNSAIALALHGNNEETKKMNFKKQNSFEGLSNLLSIEIGSGKKGKTANTSTKEKKNFTEDFNQELDKTDKNLLRAAIIVLLIFIVYVIEAKITIGSINKKQSEIQGVLDDTNNQISTIEQYTKTITAQTDKYKSLIQQIDDANEKLTASNASKNAIPNFLTQLMFNMPQKVQLLSIQNTSGKAIEIKAQSQEYEQLGYLKAALKNQGLLTEITSTAGIKQNGIISVTINGNLPY